MPNVENRFTSPSIEKRRRLLVVPGVQTLGRVGTRFLLSVRFAKKNLKFLPLQLSMTIGSIVL